MTIDPDAALERALSEGDEWQSWRALRLDGDDLGDPDIPYVDASGAALGPTGAPSPGATGELVCHLAIVGATGSAAARAALDWLESTRTPAEAWLDDPAQVPGDVDDPGAGRVWATAAASCALGATGRDPGARAVALLRGEADHEGRLTGGAYPTFAAAGAFWLAYGAKGEMAEWALRWTREWEEAWWGPWEWATALTFWGAAGIPADHPSVESFLDRLGGDAPPSGWDDLGLTLRALEVLTYFSSR